MKSRYDKKVDILFVNPPSADGFIYIRDINRHGRSSWERIKWPQTSLAYLAAVAEQAGFSVEIVDCIADEIGWNEYEFILGKCQPRFCLSNVISVTYSNDLKALEKAKEISGAVTMGMGPHLTSRPQQSIFESDGLDFIILNEAEETLRELLETIDGTDKLSEEKLNKVAGIAYIPERVGAGNGKTCVITECREFIKDLDSLPRPRHDLLPLKKYWSPFLGHYTFVEAMRGCAYRCVFCRQAVMWKWKVRGRSGAKIAEEAIYVNSLGVDNILFHADTFTLDQKMVEDLCEALIEAGTPFRWACNSHVQPLLANPGLINKMKRAGCWMIAVGIESGDNEILKKIKKQITIEAAEKVVKMIHEAGIEAWGYFVLGLPGETKESLQKTIDASLRMPLTIAKFDIAAPYPGTEFYDYVVENGYIDISRYEDFDQNASAVVNYPDLSSAEIKAAVKKANLRFYLRTAQVFRLAKELRSFATIKAIILIVRDQFRLLARGKRKRKDATVKINLKDHRDQDERDKNQTS